MTRIVKRSVLAMQQSPVVEATELSSATRAMPRDIHAESGYQKNYNTGGRIGHERLEDAQIADIKVFHDEQRKSCLTLPLAAPVSGKPDH